MKIARYQKTVCPECGSQSNAISGGTRRHGCVTVRSHRCSSCGSKFVSHQTIGAPIVKTVQS